MSSKKESTRERILETTWSLLEKGDGSSVRMSDIAKAAKLSRQSLYLHFPNRAELLVATTRYLDQVHDIEGKLHASRNAETGVKRLEEWIEVWGNYIPTIYGVAKALLAMKDTDEEALSAWNDRMDAVRDGCNAAIRALKKDNMLTHSFSEKEATDTLCALLSVRMWEQLRLEYGWTQKKYIGHIKRIATLIFILKEQD